MKIFFDTSSLVKRYIEEEGSDDVDGYFISADRIILSPVTKIELLSALTRRYLDKSIDEDSYQFAINEIEEDLLHLEILTFDSALEMKAIELIKKHGMKTLNAIQLSSAIQSGAEKFIVSDKKLFNITNTEIASESIFI